MTIKKAAKFFCKKAVHFTAYDIAEFKPRGFHTLRSDKHLVNKRSYLYTVPQSIYLYREKYLYGAFVELPQLLTLKLILFLPGFEVNQCDFLIPVETPQVEKLIRNVFNI